MITAGEKAMTICDKFCEASRIPKCGDFYNSLVHEIKIALKEQDRDTRHACAEAVIAIEPYPDGGGISKDAAHAACINVIVV